MPARRARAARARWAAPLPGVRLWVDDGELVADPAHASRRSSCGYLGRGRAERRRRPWRTGDRVTRDDDGFLYFEGRADDVIISAGYRIGPVRGRVGARRAPRRRRGGGRRRARRRARRGRARGRRPARRATRRSDGARARAAGPRQGARPRRTSTPASSTSPASCRRPRAARSAGRCCARSDSARTTAAFAAGRDRGSLTAPQVAEPESRRVRGRAASRRRSCMARFRRRRRDRRRPRPSRAGCGGRPGARRAGVPRRLPRRCATLTVPTDHRGAVPGSEHVS